MTWLRNNWSLAVTHIGALVPLTTIIRDWFTGNLTANPIQAAILRTGKPALVLLVLLLACTPLNLFFGINWVMPLRKWLGIYSSFYTGIHFLIFAGLDYGFDLSLLSEAIFTKRYAIAGFVAGIFLIPLTLTSTEGWKRRLGNSWTQLHRLVYVAALLSALHYVWLAKSDLREPLLYGTLILILLFVRIPYISQLAPSVRQFPAKINSIILRAIRRE
jgi:sulfoxide reductase heme-binding subunit YedZ